MGFLDSFIKTVSNNSYDAVDMYNELDNSDYRQTGFENQPSNHGWYRCIKCGRSFRKGDMDIDHIIPKSLGGSNQRENLQCICKHCNRSKQDNTDDTFEDLSRRRRELDRQDKEDRKFVKYAMKYKDKI